MFGVGPYETASELGRWVGNLADRMDTVRKRIDALEKEGVVVVREVQGQWVSSVAARAEAVMKAAEALQKEALAKRRELQACRERLEKEIKPSERRDGLIAELELLDHCLNSMGSAQA
jgi:hypothetical protein